MANLVNWLEKYSLEQIEAVVIGEMGWENSQYSSQKRGVVLTWEEARPMLDYEFDSGYGAPECNAITVYTKSRILFISQYDGSTQLNSLPRNPEAHMPYMPGGG